MGAGLTIREGELLMLIRAGYGNEQVAGAMALSAEELQRMLRELRAKLESALGDGGRGSAGGVGGGR
jgi:ATP/maltotriose-dependent transcriptional regulator MalT